MADIANIPQIAPFVPDADPTSVAQRWKRWSDHLDNLIVALNITDPAHKKALLLHLAGDTVYDIYQSLIVPDVADNADPDEDNVYINAKRAVDAQFNPQRNTKFEVYTFRKTRQRNTETLDAYHARLRSLISRTPTPRLNLIWFRHVRSRDSVARRSRNRRWHSNNFLTSVELWRHQNGRSSRSRAQLHAYQSTTTTVNL